MVGKKTQDSISFIQEQQTQGEPDAAAIEASCEGLTPVLEAVDELPSSSPPQASAQAQTKVKQFFIQQLSTVSASSSSSSSGSSSTSIVAASGITSRPHRVRPKEVQTLQQLQAALQKTEWPPAGCNCLNDQVAAAVQLVMAAANQAARQQLIEKNSPAYAVLLDEGYRAGIMAQGCAALRAALGIRVVTHVQLAGVLVVAQKAVNMSMPPNLDGSGGHEYAWKHLRQYYVGDCRVNSGSGSSSKPAWRLEQQEVCAVLLAFYRITATCLDPALAPCQYEIIPVSIPAELARSIFQNTSAAVAGGAFPMAVFPLAPSTSSPTSAAAAAKASSGTGFNSKAAICGSAAATTSTRSSNSSSSSAVVATAAGKGPTSSASGSSVAGGGKAGAAAGTRKPAGHVVAAAAGGAAAGAATQPGTKAKPSTAAANGSGIRALAWLPQNTAAPLDSCPLMEPFCKDFAIVLGHTALWVQSGTGDTTQLRWSLKQYMSDKVSKAGSAGAEESSAADATTTATSSSSSSSGAGGEQSGRHRSVVPRHLPLQTLQGTLEGLQGMVKQWWPEVPSLHALPTLVYEAAKEVAREEVIERNSVAYTVLLNAGYTVGVIVAGCAALQLMMGITLTSNCQLQQALIVCCDRIESCKLGMPAGGQLDAATMRQVACSLYQQLRRIAAALLQFGIVINPSALSNDGKVVMPPCSLDVAFRVMNAFQSSVVCMYECDGVMTEAKAATAYLAECEAVPGVGADVISLLASYIKEQVDAIAGPSTTKGSSKADEEEQDGTWGKGQALAGLKGLFQKPAAAAATGTKSVAVKANSAGSVTAKPAAGNTAKKPAQTQSRDSAEGSSGGDPASKAVVLTAAQRADLLVEANLRKWYCSPEGLETDVVQPLPEDSLALLKKLKLHKPNKEQGWNALHYACAGHRYELAKQLIKAGAPVNDAEGTMGLQPLHLACLGKVVTKKQFNELRAVTKLKSFIKYAGRSGPACLPLVQLLLESKADPNARVGYANDKQVITAATELLGLMPLHILTCWQREGQQADLFGNPFVGKAISRGCMTKDHRITVMAVNAAYDDLDAASEGTLSVCSACGMTDDILPPDSREARAMCTWNQCSAMEERLDWDSTFTPDLEHLHTAKVLLDFFANPTSLGGISLETPLIFAGKVGNAAIADLLLRHGALTEQQRIDGARALDVAADTGYARVGWTLLCHGATAVPLPEPMGLASSAVMPDQVAIRRKSLDPSMLVCNAIQCEDQPWNLLFLERLLADWAPVDEVCAETGETPLLMAIGYGDAEMVHMLVMAGADVNFMMEGPRSTTPLAQVLFKGGSSPPYKEMLETLLDAGADIHSWTDSSTDYDLVQTAANGADTEAVVKLVEAGANWKLPVGKRIQAGLVFYAPEILSINVPNLKLSYAEGRLKLAEKSGRQKRAAIAAALEPWLPANINPECKEATLKTLTLSGVTPGKLMTHRAKAGTWKAGSSGSGLKWPTAAAAAQQQQQQHSRGAEQAAAGGRSLQKVAVTQQDDDSADDLDALLAEIESVGEKGAAAVAGSHGSSKATLSNNQKKKKQTAAQREAKKQQQLRVAQRQQQQQQQQDQSDSGSDNDTNGREEEADALQAPDAADMTVAPPAQEQQAPAAPQEQEQQEEQEQEEQQKEAAKAQQQPKKQTNNKAAKATPQHQQQQLHPRTNSIGAEARPRTPELEQHTAGNVGGELTPRVSNSKGSAADAGQQVEEASPASAAAQLPAERKQPHPPQAVVAATPAATTTRAAGQPPQAATASAAHAAPSTTTAAPAGAAPKAAAAAVASAAGPAAASGVQQPSAAQAFLPPHLRARMPPAAAQAQAGGNAAAAAAGQVGAAVVPQAVAVPQQQPQVQQAHAQQQQQQQQWTTVYRELSPAEQMKQRMVQLAQEHQLRQQQHQQHQQQPHQQHQQQPHQQPPPARQHQQQPPPAAKGQSPPLPALPHAMMALLSGTTQQQQHPAAQSGAGAAARGEAAAAAARPMGAKRQMPAAPTPGHAQTTTLQQQQHHHPHQHHQGGGPAKAASARNGAAAASGDAVAAAGGGGSSSSKGGHKLCVMCSERRRNLLLMPCNHLVLCDVCADQMHAKGDLDSCPMCKKPCKQRIKVHQS